MDFALSAYICLFLACFITGFSKSSIGGLGIISVPILVYGFGAKPALGVFLPILIFADIWNIWLYRGLCNWRVVLGFLPSCLIGILAGFLLIDFIPDDWFTLLIGVVILLILALSLFGSRVPKFSDYPVLNRVVGMLVGLTSIIANSAGTLVGMYFLQHNMEKREFISTRNHFFLVLNSMKLPFILGLDLVTQQTLMLDVLFIPAIFLGSWVGLKLVAVIDMNVVKRAVQVAALISGVRMVWYGGNAVF